MEDYNEELCRDCGNDCDYWERQYCCTYCKYLFGDNTPCDSCDPMDI